MMRKKILNINKLSSMLGSKLRKIDSRDFKLWIISALLKTIRLASTVSHNFNLVIERRTSNRGLIIILKIREIAVKTADRYSNNKVQGIQITSHLIYKWLKGSSRSIMLKNNFMRWMKRGWIVVGVLQNTSSPMILRKISKGLRKWIKDNPLLDNKNLIETNLNKRSEVSANMALKLIGIIQLRKSLVITWSLLFKLIWKSKETKLFLRFQKPKR